MKLLTLVIDNLSRERKEREKAEQERADRERQEKLERERRLERERAERSRILKESVDSHAAVDQHFSESLRLASQKVSWQMMLLQCALEVQS